MNQIPTKFDGIEFRSRLEAKWAAMFNLCGIRWEYEPFDGNGYTPDFLIKLRDDTEIIVEVKPVANIENSKKYWDKTTRGLDGVWNGDAVFLGCVPILDDGSEFVPPIAGPTLKIGNKPTWLKDIDYLHLYWDHVSNTNSSLTFKRFTEYRTHPSDIENVWRAACNEVKWHQ
jgi:hypothetical protein